MKRTTEQTSALSQETRELTALWPPSMHALLRRAVHEEDPAERERVLMRLLRRYTRELDDDGTARWVRVVRR